ncbi:hypothetical protein [Umezawaea sp. Da 62-37]|uniref:hypothetical protein n=1 Tax=Umezawaea sp. Da 62-37 TaxID=3075927 RepID=UPI0028F7303B|nr:hypothetical protein [Umezawaea sp. Da 62-37]WNV85389.1 hypothetical protein RM788_45940 [Umezawaea sp. Da 62-37]
MSWLKRVPAVVALVLGLVAGVLGVPASAEVFDHCAMAACGDAHVCRGLDVYPRPSGGHRDAHRTIVNHHTRVAWYTNHHYNNFYLLQSQ